MYSFLFVWASVALGAAASAISVLIMTRRQKAGLHNEWKADAIQVIMRKDDRVATRLVAYAYIFDGIPAPTLNGMLAELDEERE